jgi:hypothetical protein
VPVPTRLLVRFLLTLVVGSLALVGLTSPAYADSGDEATLAERYAPVLMLVSQDEACGPGEPYLPSDVDVMFDNPTIALRGPWIPSHDLVQVGPSVEDLGKGLPGYALDLPGNPLDPGCDYEQWAASQWKGTEPTIYAHVATQSGVTDRIALQFYFFYPFNDYNNKHETDWERIQLEFAAPDVATALADDVVPDTVVYSQHYGSERATWGDDKLEIEDDTHPVVYVSAGSHANQFSAGVFMGNSASTGFGCDTTVGDHDAVHAAVETIPSDTEAALAAYPWTGYEGHWGEVGPKRFYEGPTGPNRKSGWTKPFSWSAGARDASVVVPGSGLAGSQAAQAYCDTVGKGSDAFRRFVDNPARTLTILGVVLALLVWLLRHASWRSDPLPAQQRRTAGQVVYASTWLLVRHAPLFLLLAAPMAVLLVLTAVLQTVALTSAVPGWVTAPISFLAGLSMLVSGGATTLAVARFGDGRRPGVRELYAESTPRVVAGLPAVAVAVVSIVLLAGTLILAPVALVLLAAWNLLVPVVVLEGRSGFRSLRRSLSLVRRSLTTVVPVLLLSILLATNVGALLAALVFTVAPVPFVILNAVPPLVLALVWPVVSVMSTYNYLSAVTREEERAATLEPVG